MIICLANYSRSNFSFAPENSNSPVCHCRKKTKCEIDFLHVKLIPAISTNHLFQVFIPPRCAPACAIIDVVARSIEAGQHSEFDPFILGAAPHSLLPPEEME